MVFNFQIMYSDITEHKPLTYKSIYQALI